MCKSVKMGCGPTFMLHLTDSAYVYLSIPHTAPAFVKTKSFLLTFLVEIARFSTMAHEKSDFQVLEEVKKESSDYSYVDDEDDPL